MKPQYTRDELERAIAASEPCVRQYIAHLQTIANSTQLIEINVALTAEILKWKQQWIDHQLICHQAAALAFKRGVRRRRVAS